MTTNTGISLHSTLIARLTAIASGALLALLLSSPALAADAVSAQQVETAAQHAGFASEAGDINGVHMHLHHTLNCLVGPEGEGFDADEMNPCQDMGKGAITDTADDDKKQELQDAAGKVRAGLDNDDVDAAKKTATDVKDMLTAHTM